MFFLHLGAIGILRHFEFILPSRIACGGLRKPGDRSLLQEDEKGGGAIHRQGLERPVDRVATFLQGRALILVEALF